MARNRPGTRKDGTDRPAILVGLDFSEPSRRALDQALSLARERESKLLILHVIDGEGLKEAAHLADVPEQHLREKLEHERRKRLEGIVGESPHGSGDAH